MSTLRPVPPPRARWPIILLLSIGTILLMRLLSYYAGQFHRQITYSEFYRMLEENSTTHEITEARLVDGRVDGRLKNGTGFSVFILPQDDEVLKLLREHVPSFDIQAAQGGFLGILMALSPWIIFLGIMWFVMRSAQGGGRLLS
ncbi:MAG: hypothetical protein HYZ91_03360, partial [Candidatus Omnitrophica bacterium]|nr:hypothetical protein [Candidatus Omnitrophota bacterium]